METRPEVTLLYLDVAERGVAYTFYGRGQVTDDPEVADRVFAAAPEGEQVPGSRAQGNPLIIDLERVVAQGRRPEQKTSSWRHTDLSSTRIASSMAVVSDRIIAGHLGQSKPWASAGLNL